MCEQGQLYKVSKSKDGIVKKDRLTKLWTDWVDYWAVDFDYLQHKEIIKVPVGSGLGGPLHSSPCSIIGRSSSSTSGQMPRY